MTQPKDTSELVARLRRRKVVHVGDPELGPLTGDLINPNGPEAADELVNAYRIIGEMRAAIERLGSSETMTLPFARSDNAEGRELLARIEYARAALDASEREVPYDCSACDPETEPSYDCPVCGPDDPPPAALNPSREQS